jgi:gluconokinase
MDLVVIMGVSGCGKSAVSRALGELKGWQIIEGDDHHPLANIEKMANGRPLSDHDRSDWLRAINLEITHRDSSPLVLACSALTPFVQSRLENVDSRTCHWVWLDGSYELIKTRLDQRQGHFMGSDLLRSQFDALQPPKTALPININRSVTEIVEDISQALKLS